MRLWGATCGALLGWLAADFEPFGLIVGGLFGLLAGLWLHSSVEGLARATLKRIVDAELKDYIAQQIELALAAGATRLLLDNMAPATLREAVRIVAGRVPTEASGGINLDTIKAKAATGVDYVSVGRLTQSAPAADIGLDFTPL